VSVLSYGAWEPDSAGVNARDQNGRAILQIAKNVYPIKTGYGPVQALSAIANGALPDTCKGLAFARTSSGGYEIFAGTTTHLYRFISSAWTDYTRVSGGNYNVSADDFWSFAQFGSKLIAVNINDAPQVIDVDTGATAFSALAGSPPNARYVTVVGDFVVLGCLSANNRKVRNSAINDSTGWTVGTNLCDEQEFPDGGRVTGVAGGEFGWVVQEKSIRRMDFHAGADIAFSFERVEKEHGAAAGYSVVSTINAVFFLSDDGFYSFGEQGLVPIGDQRVNRWFRSNSDTTRFFTVVAFSDPYAPRICWSFFNSSGSTIFDRLLIYNWHIDQFTYSDESAQFWATSVTSGKTLEDLDTYGSIDTGVPYSLDSRVWEGGRPVIGAVDSNGKLAFLEGAFPKDVLITTAPMQLIDSRRATVNGVYPIGIFNDATLGLRVGRRENTKSSVNYTASVVPSTSSGIGRFKASGRVHEIELSVTQASGSLWTQIQGIDVDAIDAGAK